MKKEELLKKLETYNKEYESAEEKLTSVKELWEEDFFKDNREELKELKELQKKYFEEKEKIVNEFRELQNQEGVEDETIVNKKREGRNALDKYKEVSKKINDLEQQHTKELSQLDEFEKSNISNPEYREMFTKVYDKLRYQTLMTVTSDGEA